LWGSGRAKREFLHVEDLADAVLMLMESWKRPDIINVGSGSDVSIEELARMIAGAAGYTGEILFDTTRPDGMPRKCLDTSRITVLGFRPKIDLPTGIRGMIEQYRSLGRPGATV
jgi:GDP-L-fucose synthase